MNYDDIICTYEYRLWRDTATFFSSFLDKINTAQVVRQVFKLHFKKGKNISFSLLSFASFILRWNTFAPSPPQKKHGSRTCLSVTPALIKRVICFQSL